jgi:hypothetical protein
MARPREEAGFLTRRADKGLRDPPPRQPARIKIRRAEGFESPARILADYLWILMFGAGARTGRRPAIMCTFGYLLGLGVRQAGRKWQ